MKRIIVLGLLICVATSAKAENFTDIADSPDVQWAGDGQTDGWVKLSRDLQGASAKSATGFFLIFGDSISMSATNAAWPRAGKISQEQSDKKNPYSDMSILIWTGHRLPSGRAWSADWPYKDGVETSRRVGFYLSTADASTPDTPITAAGGIDCWEYLDDPAMKNKLGSGELDRDWGAMVKRLTDGEWSKNNSPHLAFIQLGTNDIMRGIKAGDGKSPVPHKDLTKYGSDTGANILARMIEDLQKLNIQACLITIPPCKDIAPKVDEWNGMLKDLAKKYSLPVLDFHGEIMRRRPDDTWKGTLLAKDNVHPSYKSETYKASSDPYENGGAALSEVGYLLRSWLIIQKVKEFKKIVIDSEVKAE